MPVEKWKIGGANTQILTTELNSLANNTNALQSGTFANTQGAAGDGYTLCDVELVCSFGTAPTANTGLVVWLLSTIDGATFEDGSSSVTPGRSPDCVFPLRAVTGAQRIVRRVLLPWGTLKALLRNDGTGQALAASGNTLTLRPVTREGV